MFGLPHATEYDADSNDSYDVTGNTEGCTVIMNMKQEQIR